MSDQCKQQLNFLITTWEGGGSVGPMLTLARKLRDAGHGVRVMSDACNRPETEALGLRFVPWTRAPSRADRSRESEIIRDWAADNPLQGIGQVIEEVFAGRAYAYAQDVIEELRREPADLVVTNDFLFGVMAGCESIGQPVAAMSCNIIVFPVDDAPIAGPGHDRPMSADEAEQAKAMVRAARGAFDCGLPALNTARALLGIPPLASLLDQLAYARVTLVAISKYFDMVREPVPSGYRYVGPQLDEVAWTRDLTPPSVGQTKPLILVSFSTTFQNHIGILQRVIDGLASLPVDVVVTLGPTIAPDELRAAPNCHLLASVPHGPLTREASLVVTHGGHGTLARAIMHDLPLLVVPLGRDQDGNAARVEAHGTGIMLSPTASAAQIHDAAMRLLSEPAFAAAAARLGEAVRLEADESDIVGEVERLCCRAWSMAI
jgi:MGT family glycosyltransferase